MEKCWQALPVLPAAGNDNKSYNTMRRRQGRAAAQGRGPEEGPAEDTKKPPMTGGFSYGNRTGNYLLPRSFRQLVQIFFPLKDVISRESPQKMQAGWYLFRMMDGPST